MIGIQLAKKFYSYGTPKFIVILNNAVICTKFWTHFIQFTWLLPISLKYIWILSYELFHDFPNILLYWFSGFHGSEYLDWGLCCDAMEFWKWRWWSPRLHSVWMNGLFFEIYPNILLCFLFPSRRLHVWHDLHPLLRPVKDLWNVNKLCSVWFMLFFIISPFSNVKWRILIVRLLTVDLTSIHILKKSQHLVKMLPI